jgi:hypothetical protein
VSRSPRYNTYWPGVAGELGFRGRGRAVRTRNGLELSPNGGWLALRARDEFAGDPLRDLAGAPGLWRGVATDAGARLVFDLPPLLPEAGAGQDDAPHPYAALVDWAEATRDGTPPACDPPSHEDLATWLPSELRNIRAGAHLAQIEVVAKPEKLALVIAPLVRIPADLSCARRAWLGELCHDAQRRWRMVRFCLDEAGHAVRAEVDLSAAPTDRIRSLFELAGTALASSATWALPGLALVSDPNIASCLLDRPPEPGTKPRRTS